MLKIKRFLVNPVGENCYIVSDETREAIIIDCGAWCKSEENEICEYIAENNLTLTHHLCTHTHFDHIFGAGFIQKVYNLSPEFKAEDQIIYDHCTDMVRSMLGCELPAPLPIAVSHFSNDDITFGTHQFQVIHTPGHTPGGVEFYCKEEGILFSGDSLFELSIGRTDFPGGNYQDLIKSLKEHILTLPEEVVVYPGHGFSTTIGKEKSNNPYLC